MPYDIYIYIEREREREREREEKREEDIEGPPRKQYLYVDTNILI